MAESTSEIAGSLVPVARQQAMILLEAGYIWLDMGKVDKAKDVFAGAAVLMPKSEVPQLALGALEFAQGRHDKALQAYRAAQRLAPNASLPRAHAGEALLFMGKVPEATKELKAAMELEPDSDGARLAQALMQAKDAGALPPPKK
jgi:tetratricopeptide (TPR) repeat protein